MDLTTYSREKVEALQRSMLSSSVAGYEPELRHFIHGGLYAREMFMRAGTCIIGAVHLKDHLVTILGDVTIYSPEGLQRFEGYNTFESRAGTQRTLWAHDDTWVTTYHANPDGETDIAALEQRNVSKDLATIDYFHSPVQVTQ